MGFVRVDEWDIQKEDEVFSMDGRTMLMDIEKLFGEKGKDVQEPFIIKKESYSTAFKDKYIKDKKTDTMVLHERGGTHYLNYFLKYYDIDKELPLAYLRLKMIMLNDVKIKEKKMAKLIYNFIFTPSMVNKINRMVDDNWYIEIVRREEYSEQLLFEEDHAKKIMCMSIGARCVIPIALHYLNTVAGFDKSKINQFLLPLFEIFSGESDIYNKLWITVRSRIQRDLHSSNRRNWSIQEVMGEEPEEKIDSFLEDLIIQESLVKYVFSKSLIHLISVILESQLRYFGYTNYGNTLIMVDNAKSADGLSGVDKLEMNSYKLDESIPVLSSLNIQQIISRLERGVDIDDEVEYYKKHTRIDAIHQSLLYYHYVDIFSGYRDLVTLNRDDYMRLTVLLKRKLQWKGFLYLPQILTANVEKVSGRTIRNKKFIGKVSESSIYQDLIENKFSSLFELGKEEYLLKQLSTLLRSEFSYVEYSQQDILGDLIDNIDEDMLSAEFIRFLMLV